MVFDPNCWMPQDGISFSEWQARKSRTFNPVAHKAAIAAEWGIYRIGVDVGQKRDPSAIAMVELLEGLVYVRYLKRFRLGTLYSDVASTLSKLDAQLRAKIRKDGKRSDVVYAIDSTGVGQAVSEQIIDKMRESGSTSDIYCVYLTGGINANIDYETRELKLPKMQLVSSLVSAFDSNKIFFSSRSNELDAMVQELENFEINISEEGRETAGAFKTGAHDDLVVSLGLAVYLASAAEDPVQIW